MTPPEAQSSQRASHDPLTCEMCHADGTGAEITALREAIGLMLAELEGIEVAYDNGCKGAAIEVGMKALAP